jgi:hypothetical protein
MTKKLRSEISKESDGWARFRRAVHAAAESGPKHRPSKRKPCLPADSLSRSGVGKPLAIASENACLSVLAAASAVFSACCVEIGQAFGAISDRTLFSAFCPLNLGGLTSSRKRFGLGTRDVSRMIECTKLFGCQYSLSPLCDADFGKNAKVRCRPIFVIVNHHHWASLINDIPARMKIGRSLSWTSSPSAVRTSIKPSMARRGIMEPNGFLRKNTPLCVLE